MKPILLAAVAALAAVPAGAAEPPEERPYALDLTAATFGGAFDGFGVRRDSGSLAVLELSAKPELHGDRWRLEVPFRVAHRETFGADLSETTGGLDVEPWYEVSKRLRIGLEAGALGAIRPDWPDLYQRDPLTGALAPTDRYGYFAWRAGTQLYARPGRHQHLRARYRYVSYDYVADPAFDEIDAPNHLTPRDRTEHQLDASWRYREDAWAFGAGLDYTRRHYTTLQSRDARTGGTPDPATGERNPDQELSIVEPSAEVELMRLEGRLGLSFRYGVQLQNDPFQGYYSSTTHHPRVQVKLATTPRLSLQAALEGWYEIYGADGSTRLEAGNTTRVDLRTKLGGEVAYRLAGGLSVRGEVGWVKRSTNYRDYVPPPAGTSAYDIRFDYTNLTVLGGLEYKL
jgi:hypothetical protein